jgi:hypothetical protein
MVIITKYAQKLSLTRGNKLLSIQIRLIEKGFTCLYV